MLGIFVNGGIEVDYDALFIDLATRIKNEAYDERAFAFEEGKLSDIRISFFRDDMYGSDIIKDGFEEPLRQLIEAAKFCQIKLNGSFNFTTDEDPESFTAVITNNRVRYVNTAITEASNKDLIFELTRRGLFVFTEEAMKNVLGYKGEQFVKIFREKMKEAA